MSGRCGRSFAGASKNCSSFSRMTSMDSLGGVETSVIGAGTSTRDLSRHGEPCPADLTPEEASFGAQIVCFSALESAFCWSPEDGL